MEPQRSNPRYNFPVTLATGKPKGPDADAFFQLHWPAVREAVKLGMSYVAAAAAAGISDETLRNWRARYPELLAEIERAREEGKQELLELIRFGAIKDQRHAEWLLERSPPWREDYGQRARFELIDSAALAAEIVARAAALGVVIDVADAAREYLGITGGKAT